MIGILAGSEKLQRDFGIPDTGFVTTFDVDRLSDRIEHLANDVARSGTDLIPFIFHHRFAAGGGGLPSAEEKTPFPI